MHSETQNLRDFREVIWHKDCMVSGSPGGSGEAPHNRAQKIEEHSHLARDRETVNCFTRKELTTKQVVQKYGLLNPLDL